MAAQKRYFLDTNILVYSFDSASGKKARKARELIRLGVESGRGVISYQVVQEFLNVALRKFSRPLTEAEADHYLTAVLLPMLAVHSSAALFREGLRIQSRYQFSWYDSLIVASAVQSECGVLYSEDLQHGFRAGGVVVKNPFE